jgi:dTDP-N-acetylfucosamine:lipid II N-acetylfucosaminyltransferase
MLIHIFEDTPHHYYLMQRFFSQQCNVQNEQHFWARVPKVKGHDKFFPSAEFSYYADNQALMLKLSRLPNNAQIIFHGLVDSRIGLRLLFLSLVKRCSCVIWGYELYRHASESRTVKQHLAQWLHAVLLYRLKGVFTLTPGDGQLVRQYLKRKHTQVMPYPIIGLNLAAVTPYLDEKKNTIRILVGNSAAESNEHFFAFEQLAHLANDNVQIIVPLNYAGKQHYVDEVITKGKFIFGDKFIPLTQMMVKRDYDNLLASIDLAVFAHNRQQGLYVAYAMLLLGKRLYMREGTTSAINLKSLGFALESLSSLHNTTFSKLTTDKEHIQTTNQILMEQHFTEQALAPKWSKLLNNLFEGS